MRYFHFAMLCLFGILIIWFIVSPLNNRTIEFVLFNFGFLFMVTGGLIFGMEMLFNKIVHVEDIFDSLKYNILRTK